MFSWLFPAETLGQKELNPQFSAAPAINDKIG
jgi:hypothetical protein